jgi:hypothetical protein
MKSIQDLIDERKAHKQEIKMGKMMKPDHSWVGGLGNMFSDFFQAIINKVWTVRVENMPDFKIPEIRIPEIKVPKSEVTVNIPDVKVDIPEIKIPTQEIVVKIPRSSIDVTIPDIVVPDIKMPAWPKIPEAKVVVEYKYPESPVKIAYGYSERGELNKITETYKNGKKIATKENNEWVINDRRNT